MAERRRDGQIRAVSGSSRYGKTTYVMQCYGTAPRLVVFDQRGEYLAARDVGDGKTWLACERIDSIGELSRRMYASRTGPARLALCGEATLDGFEAWSKLVYAWMRDEPGVAIAEELSSSTTTARARMNWGNLVRMGSYYGGVTVGVMQRMAEADKTIFGNVHSITCFCQVWPRDCETVASIFPELSPEHIAELKRGEYFRRDLLNNETRWNRIHLPKRDISA